MLSGFELDAPASTAMLDAAKRHLREFDVVGLTERFDESVALLHHVYGWKMLAIPNRRVRTHTRPAIDSLAPAAVEGLRRLNALDEELYAEGALIFSGALERAGSAVSQDAQALQVAKAIETASGAGMLAAASAGVASRAAGIAADTVAALDADLIEQAHGIAMALVPHTTEVSAALGAHVQQIASLARRLTDLVRKQEARM
jgi:hypothetical protein